MTEFNDGQKDSGRWIGISEQGTFHTADKTYIGLGVHKSSEDISTREIKEAVGNTYGIDPDRITVEDPRLGSNKKSRNMASAAFRGWNSSWTPQGDADRAGKTPYDPNMN